MSDWNASQYLQFEDERTRLPRDLLAQVPMQRVRMAVDLGCGPGNSTELLVERYPDATVLGLDSSKDMFRQARERLPQCTFIEADLTTWTPDGPVDLLFANAVYQWVPDHQMALRLYLASFDAQEANEFLEAYTMEIARHYATRADGKTLLRLPRLFIVATR